jgi:Flp pilus assembly protein TadB
MNKEIVIIGFALAAILALGISMLYFARWSRKKSERFKRSKAGENFFESEIKNKPILEQLKSKETWEKVKDGLSRHDPFSEKGCAIKHDVVGYLGWLPFVIVTLIAVALITIGLFIVSLI